MITGDEVINPQGFSVDKNGNVYLAENYSSYNGLNIRQHYAGLLMAANISSNDTTPVKYIFETLGLPPDTEYEYPKHYMMYMAKISVAGVNALIDELNK